LQDNRRQKPIESEAEPKKRKNSGACQLPKGVPQVQREHAKSRLAES